MANQLAPAKRRRFKKCCDLIRQNIHNTASLVLEIHRDQIYLDDYESFEEAMAAEFNWSRSWANDLKNYAAIQAAIVDSNSDVVEATDLRPSHMRAIASVPDENRVQVIEQAKLAANESDSPLTANILKQTADQFVNGSPSESMDAEVEHEYVDEIDEDELDEELGQLGDEPPEPESFYDKRKQTAVARADQLLRDVDELNESKARPVIFESIMKHIKAVGNGLEDW